ncbi:MAG: AAA family ATPase [Firmicutes bacterium]|nr:AAA family ATPase [Bacillota bacterium]
MLRLGLLGKPYMIGATGPVTLSTKKGEALVWYLAAQPTGSFTRSHLASLLWEDADERSGRRTLTAVLVSLRRALPVFPIRTFRDRLAWDPDAPVEVDLADFCKSAGQSADPPQAGGGGYEREASELAAAVAVRRGPFLDGFSLPDSEAYEEWLQRQREFWDRRALEILERLSRQAEAGGNWQSLAAYSRQALGIDPAEETFHRRLMLALAASGNRSAALAQYETCRRLLRTQLAVEPDPATTALRDAIAEGRMSVPSASAVRGVGAGALGRGRPLPVVGRDELVRTVLDRLARAENPRAVLLHGETGIGKTRLTRAVLDKQGWSGTTLIGHCYETSQALPYAPFVEALGALSGRLEMSRIGLMPAYLEALDRLLPGLVPLAQRPAAGRAAALAEERSPLLDHLRDQQVLFEAVVRLLVALPPPVRLVVEDLHWADETSLGLLAYLLRHPLSEGVAVLMTARAEDLSTPSSLLLRTLERERRMDWVDVGPLSQQAVRSLVATVTGREDHALADRLHRDTGGNPLFAVELLQALRDASDDDRSHVGGTIPATVEAVVAARLIRLSPSAQALARALAVFRWPVPLAPVREVAGLGEEEAVQALERLLQARLVEETDDGRSRETAGAPRVSFRHEVFAQVARQGMSKSRRALLHRRAFHALVRWMGRREEGSEVPPMMAEALAEHAVQGGLWREGLDWNVRLGDMALGNYAYASAMVRLRKALDCMSALPATQEHERLADEIRLRLAHINLLLGREDEEGSVDGVRAPGLAEPPSESQLLLVQGHALQIMLRGRLALAQRLLERGLEHARAGPHHLVPYALVHLGHLYVLRGEYTRAVSLLEEAVALGDPRRIHIAEGLGVLGTALALLGDFDRARAVVQDMREQGRQAENTAVIALASAHLAQVLHAEGEWAAAVEAGEESLRVSEAEGLAMPQYLAAVHLGLPRAHAGDVNGGIRAEERAIALAERTGMRILLDHAYAYLAQLAAVQGDLPAAERAIARAEAIASEDGYPYGLALSAKVRGIVAAQAGRLSIAHAHLGRALAQFASLGVAPEVARCRALLASLTRG